MVVRTGQTLTSAEAYALGSSAIAEVRNGAVINAGTLKVSAHTNTTFTYDGQAPADTAYNYVAVANGGSVNVSVTNLTKAGAHRRRQGDRRRRVHLGARPRQRRCRGDR